MYSKDTSSFFFIYSFLLLVRNKKFLDASLCYFNSNLKENYIRGCTKAQLLIEVVSGTAENAQGDAVNQFC